MEAAHAAADRRPGRGAEVNGRAWLLAAAAVLAVTPAAGQGKGWPCQSIHGRLFAANGAPTFRIAPTGSRRILGVRQAEGEGLMNLPDPLPKLLAPDAFQVRVTADFRVCPLTPDRPGRMRMVRLAGVSRAVAEPAR